MKRKREKHHEQAIEIAENAERLVTEKIEILKGYRIQSAAPRYNGMRAHQSNS